MLVRSWIQQDAHSFATVSCALRRRAAHTYTSVIHHQQPMRKQKGRDSMRKPEPAQSRRHSPTRDEEAAQGPLQTGKHLTTQAGGVTFSGLVGLVSMGNLV